MMIGRGALNSWVHFFLGHPSSQPPNFYQRQNEMNENRKNASRIRVGCCDDRAMFFGYHRRGGAYLEEKDL